VVWRELSDIRPVNAAERVSVSESKCVATDVRALTLGRMATVGRPAEEVGLQALMAYSPESRVHMSVAAESAFLLGLCALLTAPFSALFAITGLLSLGAVVLGIIGMITTRDPELAGSALAPLGMMIGLVAAGLVGLRYFGLDTAFGDDFAPWFWQVLQSLNAQLPQP
jgi:hypothetical protein